MSVIAILFNADKYIRVTKGNQALIALGGKTTIKVFGPNGENVLNHTPCLAWATLSSYPDLGNKPNNAYIINSFVGNVDVVGTGENLNSMLTANTLVAKSQDAIIIGGGY